MVTRLARQNPADWDGKQTRRSVPDYTMLHSSACWRSCISKKNEKQIPPCILYAFSIKSIKSSNPRVSGKQLSQTEHTAPASSSVLQGFALKMSLRTGAPPSVSGMRRLSPPLPKLLHFTLFPLPFLAAAFSSQDVAFGI